MEEGAVSADCKGDGPDLSKIKLLKTCPELHKFGAIPYVLKSVMSKGMDTKVAN